MAARPIYPRELVAEHLAISPRLLIRYEARGLVHPVADEAGCEGYGPAEIRRVWSIVTLQRDLGVNLAGVEAILRLRAHVDLLHHTLAAIADELLTEPPDGPEAIDPEAPDEA